MTSGRESRLERENPALFEARKEGFREGYLQAAREILNILNGAHDDVMSSLAALRPLVEELDGTDPENTEVLANLEHSANTEAVVALVVKSIKDKVAEKVQQVPGADSQ